MGSRKSPSSESQSSRVSSGRSAENAVEEIAGAPQIRSLARLWRSHPGYRGGKPVLPQGPDFHGILWDGRFLYVEVKSISGKRARLAIPSARRPGALRLGAFTKAEVERMDDCEDRGGIAIVLVQISTGNGIEWCVLPWRHIRLVAESHGTRHAKKSLSASEILEHACPPELFLREGLEKAGAFWKKAELR